MAARSYSPSASKGKIAVFALFSLMAWHLPALGPAHAKAAELDNSQVFEIKSTTPIDDLGKQKDAQAEAQIQQQVDLAKLNKKVTLVRSYLQSKNSPLATYTEYLVSQDDWKTIIAVSNSESNMGLHCYRNNCSGIFGSQGLKSYETIPDWIVDFQSLIDKRYKGMTLNQMDGVYVQPRSTNWLVASSRVYNDLSEIEAQANSVDDLQAASIQQ